jgi:hypothetical protein
MKTVRLTARSPKNNRAYLVKVKPDEQEVESLYPNTLRCIMEAFERLAQYEDAGQDRPEIVCLCGSTRFFKTFDEWNFILTLEGKIVLSIGCNTKSDEGLKLTADDKVKLDELHKRKIDLCDTVFVLNVDGYIGDSTRSEIEYAEQIGKLVKYLEEPVGCFICGETATRANEEGDLCLKCFESLPQEE